MSYRIFFIKKKNGKKRKICAPDKEWLYEQRKILPKLFSIFIHYETLLFKDKIFHGFINNRSYITAAEKHIGYKYTLMLDIENFFDSVYLSDLLDLWPLLKEHINEKNKQYFQTNEGTLAQGFATSPILASLYLLPIIKKIKEIFDILDLNYELTVYADDLQISFNNEYTKEFKYMIINIIQTEFKKAKLNINPKKTRVRFAKYGNRRILGVMVGATKIYPTRKLKRKIRAARYQKNYQSLGGLMSVASLHKPNNYI